MVRRDYRAANDFDSSEIISVILVALLLAFALTFRMWGDETFDAALGLFNLVFVFVGMLIAVFMHEAGHKIAALAQGYEARIERFGGGLVASGFITLYSQGLLPLVTPNLLELDARPDLRMRKYRKYESAGTMASIAAAGIIGSTLAVVLFKTLFLFTGQPLFMVIVLGAILHAVFSMIPFEIINLFLLRLFERVDTHTPSDGLHIYFFGSRTYVFVLVFVIFFGGIAMLTGWVSYLLSLLLAAAATLVIDRMQAL